MRSRFADRFGDRAKFDERLAPYVAYRVGGPADVLLFPETEADLIWISDTCRAHGIPVTVIGTGTNLLVRDEGIRGVVISLLSIALAKPELALAFSSETTLDVEVSLVPVPALPTLARNSTS